MPHGADESAATLTEALATEVLARLRRHDRFSIPGCSLATREVVEPLLAEFLAQVRAQG
jgi:hypothetical protein